MSVFGDNEKLDIKCPQCNKEFSKTIRELRGTGVKCPSCGVRFETSDFKRKLGDLDRMIEQSFKDIKLNIKL